MIPHDCYPEIPALYMEHIRRIALAKGAQAHYPRELLPDLIQDGVVALLSNIALPDMANPSEKAWRAVCPAVMSAMTETVHAETRDRDASLEQDYPGMLEGIEQESDSLPTWIPSDPKQRLRIVKRCRRILKNEVRTGRRPGYKHFRTALNVLGTQVSMGGFANAREARQARDEALRRIIEWCTPIFPPRDDSGDAARRFVELHIGARMKPAIFYGDPLEYLIYLEDFAERVQHGHRYFVGDASYELERKAR